MFDVWKNVLAELEQAIPRDAFATWFDGVTLISLENGVVRVGTPNVFKRGQIEKKYSHLIEQALEHNDVKFDSIEYIVASEARRGRKTSIGIDDIAAPKREPATSKRQISPATTHFDTGLNPKYTMESFVIGSNNDLAVSVAKNIIENPGDRYNPFFLYGGPGLGKTHLVQAIGNELKRRNPQMKILYTPTNHFYSEFIAAIRKNHDIDAFSQKYRSLDVLIMDDFQMLINKDASQREFFDLFNDLHQLNRQIIVTSDRLPDQIESVDERLSSRLAMSGPIDLQMPSFEDKCAILQSKAEFLGVAIEDEAIEYLAENVKTNIRDLEGEFNRLRTIAEWKNITPLEVIKSGYASTTDRAPRRNTITSKQIVEKVAKYYELSVVEMRSKSRVAHIKNARQVAMYILREELGMSTTKIAAEVGVKDHTTVMHGIEKITEDLKLNYPLREQINTIREEIYA